MREIKFRAQDFTKTWNYGYVAMGNESAVLFPKMKDGSVMIGIQIYVLPETVGQFTGLKDKKDKEIYEGDIMYTEFSDGSGGYSLIGWNEREASFGMMDAYSYQSKQEGYDFPEFKNYVLIAHLQKALICEVVGNIYDKPELMNVKK